MLTTSISKFKENIKFNDSKIEVISLILIASCKKLFSIHILFLNKMKYKQIYYFICVIKFN